MTTLSNIKTSWILLKEPIVNTFRMSQNRQRLFPSNNLLLSRSLARFRKGSTGCGMSVLPNIQKPVRRKNSRLLLDGFLCVFYWGPQLTPAEKIQFWLKLDENVWSLIATYITQKHRRKTLHCCDKSNESFDIFQVNPIFKTARQLGLEVRIWLDTTKIQIVFTKFSHPHHNFLSLHQLHGHPVVNTKRTRLGTLWKLRGYASLCRYAQNTYRRDYICRYIYRTFERMLVTLDILVHAEQYIPLTARNV